jgi:hypothetical protein
VIKKVGPWKTDDLGSEMRIFWTLHIFHTPQFQKISSTNGTTSIMAFNNKGGHSIIMCMG